MRAPGAAFLAALSRELREPLRLIRRYVALITDTAHDPTAVAGLAGELEQTLRQQAEFADDLLEVAHLAEGLPLNRSTFDLVAPLRASVDRHRADGREQDVELSLDAPPDPVLVSGDQARLEHALDKLLGTAVAGAAAGHAVRTTIRPVDGHCEIEIAEANGDPAPRGEGGADDENSHERKE